MIDVSIQSGQSMADLVFTYLNTVSQTVYILFARAHYGRYTIRERDELSSQLGKYLQAFFVQLDIGLFNWVSLCLIPWAFKYRIFPQN